MLLSTAFLVLVLNSQNCFTVRSNQKQWIREYVCFYNDDLLKKIYNIKISYESSASVKKEFVEGW